MISGIEPPTNLTDEKPYRIIEFETRKLEKHKFQLTYALLSQKPAPMYPILVPNARKLLEGRNDGWAAAPECIKNL